MSEYGGLWKHQNNPACTKRVSLQNVKAEHYISNMEEEQRHRHQFFMEIKKAQMLQLIHPTSQIQVITPLPPPKKKKTAYFLTSLFPCLCLVLGACTFKTVILIIKRSLHTLGAMLWKPSSGLFHSPKLAPNPFSQRMPGHSGTGLCCCSDRLLKPAQNKKLIRSTGTQIPGRCSYVTCNLTCGVQSGSFALPWQDVCDCQTYLTFWVQQQGPDNLTSHRNTDNNNGRFYGTWSLARSRAHCI